MSESGSNAVAPPPPQPLVLGLMTGVIDSRESALHMRHLLEGAIQQTTKLDLFCASIYVDPKLCATSELLAGLKDTLFEQQACQVVQSGRLKILWQTVPNKPLFVQYQELLTEMLPQYKKECAIEDDNHNVWVCFTEGDAVWHPNRIHCLKGVLEVVSKTIAVKAIIAPQQTLLHAAADMADEIYTPDIVNTLLEHKALEIRLNQDPEKDYVNWCIRAPMLLQFLQEHPFLVQHNPTYCDVALLDWVWNYPGAEHILLDMKHWLYFSRAGTAWHKRTTRQGKISLPPLPSTTKNRDYTAALENAILLSEIPSYQQLSKQQYAQVLAACKNRSEQEMYIRIHEALRQERVIKCNIFMSKACACCGKPNTAVRLLSCSVCKRTRYCSKECQKKHWTLHKSTCSHPVGFFTRTYC